MSRHNSGLAARPQAPVWRKSSAGVLCNSGPRGAPLDAVITNLGHDPEVPFSHGRQRTRCLRSVVPQVSARWETASVDDQPVVGWNRDPGGPDKYRYWNGTDWTCHATAARHNNHRTVMFGVSDRGWRNFWYLRVLRNTVVFHTMAWFECSVPLTRGHLRRFMEPRELRTLDQIWALRDGT